MEKRGRGRRSAGGSSQGSVGDGIVFQVDRFDDHLCPLMSSRRVSLRARPERRERRKEGATARSTFICWVASFKVENRVAGLLRSFPCRSAGFPHLATPLKPRPDIMSNRPVFRPSPGPRPHDAGTMPEASASAAGPTDRRDRSVQHPSFRRSAPAARP